MAHTSDYNENQIDKDVASELVYNRRPLVKCTASYLGAAIPTLTTQPPGIILEPLDEICSSITMPTGRNSFMNPVRLYIFHSAVIIEVLHGNHVGSLVWYPIQNLYCSAGLVPIRNQLGKLEFMPMDAFTMDSEYFRPVFAIVLRESISKKVLKCHAFSVINSKVAKFLVKASAVAFRDKNGWNRPLLEPSLPQTGYIYSLNSLESKFQILDFNSDNISEVEIGSNRSTDDPASSTSSDFNPQSLSESGVQLTSPSSRSDSTSSGMSSNTSHLHSPVSSNTSATSFVESSTPSMSSNSSQHNYAPQNIRDNYVSTSKTNEASRHASLNGHSRILKEHGHHKQKKLPSPLNPVLELKGKTKPKFSEDSNDTGKYKKNEKKTKLLNKTINGNLPEDYHPKCHPDNFMYGDSTINTPSPPELQILHQKAKRLQDSGVTSGPRISKSMQKRALRIASDRQLL